MGLGVVLDNTAGRRLYRKLGYAGSVLLSTYENHHDVRPAACVEAAGKQWPPP